MPPSKTQLAIKEDRTLFPTSVKEVGVKSVLLKPASNNAKLGNGKDIIEKGPWKGFPLFSLTLEERATCPKDCHHYDDCYGNNVPFAARFKAGKDLEDKLKVEVAQKARLYDGFVVRLHVLGDFYSVEYVNLWNELLNKYPQLHIFGYTARNSGPIYQAIRKLLLHERVMLRFSVDDNQVDSFDTWDSLPHYFATNSASDLYGIQCPEQVSKTDSCVTCGLCLNPNFKKTIKFLSH